MTDTETKSVFTTIREAMRPLLVDALSTVGGVCLGWWLMNTPHGVWIAAALVCFMLAIKVIYWEES